MLNRNVYFNLPILTAVYCYNNGTGICKALAGRFEFYVDSWRQKYLGPVEAGPYVDSNGYHERVPHTYTLDGKVLYEDRPINWSRWFTKNQTKAYNLLSSTSFNWCRYAQSNNWPYKSAILDHDKSYAFYFFNRQSCIVNLKTKELQHYNTRFLHKSQLRIDLDYNPTMFAMEDYKTKDVRLVKHVRQHWYECKWELLKNIPKGPKYFVRMYDRKEGEAIMLDGTGPFLRHSFYNTSTKLCVSDYYCTSANQGPNARLVPSYCGADATEIAVYLREDDFRLKAVLYEVSIHTIPRWPEEAHHFFGVDVTLDSDWEKFAKDGHSFSACTAIPVPDTQLVEVIMLYSSYTVSQPSDIYDEHYPKTFISRYQIRPANAGRYKFSEAEAKITVNRVEKLNLNYVDDIAYLPGCETILVIVGPLYTEFPTDKFGDLNISAPLGSIYDLGANELVTAFFAPEKGKLFFYHRLNFIVEHKYTCAGSGKPLVTATRVSKYYFKDGKNTLEFRLGLFDPGFLRAQIDAQEETIFKDLGIYKGQLGSPEAPDAAKYPWSPDDQAGEYDPGPMPWWVWLLIALGILGLIVMFALGFMALRRLQRRRKYLALTKRSQFSSVSGIDNRTTNRDSSRSSRKGSVATVRSGRSSSLKSGGGSGITKRSRATTGAGSRQSSRGTKRSGISSATTASRRASSASRPSSQSATKRSSSISSGKRSMPKRQSTPK